MISVVATSVGSYEPRVLEDKALGFGPVHFQSLHEVDFFIFKTKNNWEQFGAVIAS